MDTDIPTVAMWALSVIGAFAPLFATRWGRLALVIAVSAALILLGGFLCGAYGDNPGLGGIICFIVPAAALALGLSSTVVAACRCCGKAHGWKWGLMPRVLLPGVFAYSVPAIAWAMMFD